MTMPVAGSVLVRCTVTSIVIVALICRLGDAGTTTTSSPSNCSARSAAVGASLTALTVMATLSLSVAPSVSVASTTRLSGPL